MMSVTSTPSVLKTSQRNQFIQFARGFSILTIVFFHYLRVAPLPSFAAQAIAWGGAGIHIFLFLSGYGLSLSHHKDWIAFFKRRFLKILVPYYIGILTIFGLNVWLGIYPDGFHEMLSHLLLYKMFIEPYMRSFGGHFWFISTIVQFYLVYPLLSQLVERLGSSRSMLLAGTFSLGYSLFLIYLDKADVRAWNSFFLQYLWEFVLGMIVARNQLLPRLLKQPLYVYIVVGILGNGITAVLATKAGQKGQIINDFFAFTGYACVCMIVYRLGNVLTWSNRFVLWVETFSYPLYIMHMVPLGVYLKFFPSQSLTLYTVIAVFIAALCLSLFFNYGVTRLVAIPYSRVFKPDLSTNYPLDNLFKFFSSVRP